jgi:PhnB protein
MAALNPYLNFNGKAEEAFNFYKSVFGGEFAMVSRFKDIPAEYKSSDSEDQKIMHIALPISGGGMLMGSDVPEHMGNVINGTNVHIAISPDSQEEAQKLFDGLSAGGNVIMPFEKAFWGAYFGMFTDKYGISWMVNYDTNQQQR